jgi:hypothetical protein
VSFFGQVAPVIDHSGIESAREISGVTFVEQQTYDSSEKVMKAACDWLVYKPEERERPFGLTIQHSIGSSGIGTVTNSLGKIRPDLVHGALAILILGDAMNHQTLVLGRNNEKRCTHTILLMTHAATQRLFVGY